jgi:hypothetical protein
MLAEIPAVLLQDCIPTNSVDCDADYGSRHQEKEHKDDLTNWPIERQPYEIPEWFRIHSI